MTNEIFQRVQAQLSEPAGRIVVQVAQAGCASKVYGPADLSKIKPEGTGLRIGRLYVFACQVRFARVQA